MRFRIFGRIVRVPKAALMAIGAILILAVILIVNFTEPGSKAPELVRNAEATGEDLAAIGLTPEPENPNSATDNASGELSDAATPAPTADTRMAVHITGAVVNEGVCRLEPGAIILDAVELCGGLLPDADTYSINLAMKVNDGMRIHIPFTYSENKTWLLDVGYASPQTDNGSGTSQSTVQLVNINTASVNELMTLNGIGESTARDIISYREEHGKFQSIEDIMNVPGIKDAKFNKIKKYITV
jgi:competence protein ComEA